MIAIVLGSGDLPENYQTYLLILMVVDVISLAFDFPDIWKWYSGDRLIA